jgi:hypothetical protein
MLKVSTVRAVGVKLVIDTFTVSVSGTKHPASAVAVTNTGSGLPPVTWGSVAGDVSPAAMKIDAGLICDPRAVRQASPQDES